MELGGCLSFDVLATTKVTMGILNCGSVHSCQDNLTESDMYAGCQLDIIQRRVHYKLRTIKSSQAGNRPNTNLMCC